MSKPFRIDRDEITIRLMTPDDAAQVFSCRTHPDVAELQGWFPEDEDEVRELAEEQAGRTPGEPGIVQLVIEWRSDFVGDIGVVGSDDGKQVEFGISVLPEFHGHGFATIACRVLFGELFRSGTHRITARIDTRNAASKRLLEKLDFRQEGLEKKSYWDERKQEWTDELVFALLEEEWPSH